MQVARPRRHTHHADRYGGLWVNDRRLGRGLQRNGASMQGHDVPLPRHHCLLQDAASTSTAPSASASASTCSKGWPLQGTYTDGTFIEFDVGLFAGQSGTSLANISYDENGECGSVGTSYGNGFAPGPFAIQPDGSFQASYQYTDTGSSSPSTGTVTVSGKLSPDGTGSGTLSDTFTFTGGDFQGTTCTSTGTWTAQLQP